MSLRWHQFAQRFPRIHGEEAVAFQRSIQEAGGNEIPVEYRIKDGEREYLDGRNRQAACEALGLAWAEKEVVVADEDVKNFILRRNVHRRHLTPEFRRELVAELTADGRSTRDIAAVLGVSNATVHRDQEKSGVTNVTPENPPVVHGLDGKDYMRTERVENQASEAIQTEQRFDFAALDRDIFALARHVDALAAINQGGADKARSQLLAWQSRFVKFVRGIQAEAKREKAVKAIPIPGCLDNPEFLQEWERWQQHRREKRARLTPTAAKQQLADLADMGLGRALATIRHSIGKGWTGIFEPDGNKAGKPEPIDARKDRWDRAEARAREKGMSL